MLLTKSSGAEGPNKTRIVEAQYRAEKGFSRPSVGFANSIAILGFPYGTGSKLGQQQREAGLQRDVAGPS
ncbi:MAG TPA: hypothetical protein VE712_04220, partial [Actinomycetota bacterium]|nr:hypothetical protein [Actinomycetota bacterium]